MPQRTIVMLRLDLQGFLWRALLNEALPELENQHLGIRPAQNGRPCQTEPFEDLRDLCDHLAQLEGGAAIINLRFSAQLERQGTSLLPLVEEGAAVFIHSRDSEILGKGIGRELLRLSRPYEASPVASGKEPSDKQQAWLDLLAKLGVARPPCILASLAHDFMGKIGSLQLALHSMEPPDGTGLVVALRRSMGGGGGEVEAFFEDFQNIYTTLRKQLEIRLNTAEISERDKERVKSWLLRTKDVMRKLGRLVSGDRQAGSGIESDLIALRQELNATGSVRL